MTAQVLLKKPGTRNIENIGTEIRDPPFDAITSADDPPQRGHQVRGKQMISYRMPSHLYTKAQELVERGAFGSLTDLMTYAITRFIDEEYRGLVSRKEMSTELRKIVDEEMGRFMREMLEEHQKSKA